MKSSAEERISDDWFWREKELRAFDALWLSKPSDVLVKAGVMLVYSHWEGLFKFCATEVLKTIDEGVKRKYFKWTDLKHDVRMRIIFCYYRKAISSGISRDMFIGYLNSLSDARFDKALEAHDEVIVIDDNLNASRAEAVCRNLGVESSWCILKKIVIDERIVAYRNAFAHGSNRLRSGDHIDLSDPEIYDAIEETRYLIRETKDRFSNCLALRSFVGD